MGHSFKVGRRKGKKEAIVLILKKQEILREVEDGNFFYDFGNRGDNGSDWISLFDNAR